MTDGKSPRSAPAFPSDDALMRRAADGDVEAFAQIYDRHAPTVLAVARRLMRGAGGEEDLVHDVFVEAWQAAREYDPQRAPLRVWLLVRTRSRALDRKARHAREDHAREALAHGDASSRQLTPQTERQLRCERRSGHSPRPCAPRSSSRTSRA